jgi:hypothetical protein
MEEAFPELEKTQLERKRLWGKKKKTKEAKTEIGQRLQKELGAAAVVADRAG